MADPKVTIEIEAADKTKAAAASASKEVEKVGAAAKRSAFDAKKAWQGYGVAMRNAAVIVGGTALIIKQAFDMANASAERLGRADVTSAFTNMQTAGQIAYDTFLQSSGALDLMRDAMYGLEFAARALAIAFIALKQNASKAMVDIGSGIGELAQENDLVQAGLNAIAGTLSLMPGVDIDLSNVRGLTEAEKAAQYATIDATATADAYRLSNEALAVALANRAKKETDVAAATKKSTSMTKAAESEYAKQKKQQQAQTYAELLRIAQDYQAGLKEINAQGTGEIEDAIRNGDARALADAKKSKTDALAELEKNKADALKQLAFSFMDTSTLGGAQKGASFMGVGEEFAALMAQYNQDYGTPRAPVSSAPAGGKLGHSAYAETQGFSSKTGGGTFTGAGMTPGNVNVQVFIGNEQLNGQIKTVIAENVFKSPSSNGQSAKVQKKKGNNGTP